jgi:hypothetical protein
MDPEGPESIDEMDSVHVSAKFTWNGKAPIGKIW